MTVDELAALITDTGHHHHQAYIESDGADPEWPLWYAGYLQAQIWDAFGAVPSRSRLVYLLLAGERAHAESGGDTPWPTFYAQLIIDELAG